MSPTHHWMAGRVQAQVAQEVAVPDRPAGGVAVHADALAGQVLGPPDRTVAADVQVAGREVAQREHGQADVAAVALLHAVEVLRHRPLAALDLRVLHGAPQHLGARRPRPPAPQDHGERDAFRLHLAGGERKDAGVVRARQGDSNVGHRQLLDRAAPSVARGGAVARGTSGVTWVPAESSPTRRGRQVPGRGRVADRGDAVIPQASVRRPGSREPRLAGCRGDSAGRTGFEGPPSPGKHSY